METLENAIALLLQHAQPITETETVALWHCVGRVAGSDIAAKINVPPFNRSPLDGYALHSEDLKGASPDAPVQLKVIGEADAGCRERFIVNRGEALRIMTGAPVPDSCDCVIRQEDTDQGMDIASFYAEVGHMQNICFAGEDVHAGHVLIHKGDLLTTAHVGILAGQGMTEVNVFRKLRVALLCTGDELVQPGGTLDYGQIYDSNKALFVVRLQELGAEVHCLESAGDDPDNVARMIREAAEDADVIITGGGVSVGKKDIFHQVLPLLGAERLFWRVQMKPGSPLLCATYQNKLMICMSGNPYASVCTLEIYAKPVLRKLAGMSDYESRHFPARFSGTYSKGGKQRRLVRGFFNGETVALTGMEQSNGSLLSCIGCNCLIDIPSGHGPLADGEMIDIWML